MHITGLISQVVMEYADYVERYSEDVRYMHMPMLEHLGNGRILAVWQAAPLTGFGIEVPPLPPSRRSLPTLISVFNQFSCNQGAWSL